MPIYWKNQYQPEGAVKVKSAQAGGSGMPGVSGFPAVSVVSSQDEQDRLCVCEERVCVCTDEQIAYIERAIDEADEPHVHQSQPDEHCTDPACRPCSYCGEPVPESDPDDYSAYCSRDCYNAAFL